MNIWSRRGWVGFTPRELRCLTEAAGRISGENYVILRGRPKVRKLAVGECEEASSLPKDWAAVTERACSPSGLFLVLMSPMDGW